MSVHVLLLTLEQRELVSRLMNNKLLVAILTRPGFVKYINGRKYSVDVKYDTKCPQDKRLNNFCSFSKIQHQYHSDVLKTYIDLQIHYKWDKWNYIFKNLSIKQYSFQISSLFSVDYKYVWSFLHWNRNWTFVLLWSILTTICLYVDGKIIVLSLKLNFSVSYGVPVV